MTTAVIAVSRDDHVVEAGTGPTAERERCANRMEEIAQLPSSRSQSSSVREV